jgi:hypothetical protein
MFCRCSYLCTGVESSKFFAYRMLKSEELSFSMCIRHVNLFARVILGRDVVRHGGKQNHTPGFRALFPSPDAGGRSVGLKVAAKGNLFLLQEIPNVRDIS